MKKKELPSHIESAKKAHGRKKKRVTLASFLALLVVICTVCALMIPASTLEATASLPEGAEVPDGYTQQYTVNDEENGFTVTVYAAEGVLPEGAQLSAQLLDEEDDAYAQAEEALALDEESSFAALDISFTGEDGSEIEPDGDVYVVIDAQGLLPEEADADTVTVQHHAESEDGITVETVADTAEDTQGIVAVADESTVQAAFSVSSFSTFTISWSTSGFISTTYFTVTVHYVDEDGNEIQGSQTTSISTNSGGTYTFSDYAGSISGYTYSGAHYSSYNGSTVTGMTFSESRNTRTLTFSNGSTTVATLTYSRSAVTASVYLVYEAADFYIEDNVSSSGEYTVVYNGTEGSIDDYTFVWYRDDGSSDSDTSYPTGENDWDEVVRTRVSGSMYNLSENSQSLNIALDAALANAEDDDRFWYKIEVYNAGDELVATLYQKSMYYYELQNGGFESPALQSYGQSSNLTDANEEVIWKTTDTQSLIEIIKPSSSATLTTHGVSSAPEGDQIAELNAESEGTLYQSVLTVPGSTLNWQLLHRVRNYAGGTTWYSGYDTMYVVIMSEEAAANITTQDQVNAVIDEAGFDQDYYYTSTGMEEKTIESGTYAGTVVWRITDYIEGQPSLSDTGWTRYMDSYTVPEGQYLTRFFFASGATSYDNNPNATQNLKFTVGNLLDDVAFTTDILDPDEGSATLSVTKTVSGLSDEDLDGYTVTFDVTDSGGEDLGTITISNFTANTDGTYSGTGYLTIELDSDETSKEVTITEELQTVTGYSVTTTVSGSASADSSDSLKATATLYDGSTTSVTYTNTYLKSTENVTVKKTDDDGNTLGNAQFMLYYTEDGTNYYYCETTADGKTTVTWVETEDDGTPLTSDSDGILTFYDLDRSKIYYLEEIKAPDGYLLTDIITIQWDGETLKAAYTNGSGDLVDDDGYIVVKNSTGQELPETGGTGTAIYTIGGAALMLAAAVIGICSMKRKRRAQ